MIKNNILETIGNTPLVKLNNLTEDNMADIYVKVESKNPSGSIKDRPAYQMVKDALGKGIIKKGDTIVESTSGNMGIGLSMIGAVLGLNIVIVMPDTMSIERRKLFQAYGAKLILTPGAKGMQGSVDEAKRLSEERGYFLLNQFVNPSNPLAHERTTAKELLEDLDTIDVFVAGVGTGGTISGTGKVLKEKLKNIKIVAVEPKSGQILKGKPGPHKIQGIGANFIPETYYGQYVDEIFDVSDEESYEMTRELAKKEGILAGISSGANVFAAIEYAKNLGKGKTVVTVLPDTGERYLSTDLFLYEE
ncbi:cysteine synthase A [Anaerosphaera multitolerans]|uniref:Cysteine synthase n=1 Tax=Anaerosphaera multitolerans TaxID=2487351 RepID=A0A437S8Z6_9FIRM|nr:cysteine synthase A [Anaerosphaera multitolerans]RVU55381.1 cysteine synthase A [Anaerosphaera multitolerans]